MTYEDVDRDTLPYLVEGEHTTHYVETLGYTQHFIGGVQVQPSTVNAFCATGEGGGVDPSCGKTIVEVRKAIKALPTGHERGIPTDRSRQVDVGAVLKRVSKEEARAVGDAIASSVTTTKVITMSPKQLRQLRVSQDTVGEQRLLDMAKLDLAKLPPVKVDVHDSKKYLEDGNHRVVLAILKGESLKVQLTSNAFCATGEGGGVDPSCPPVSKEAVDYLLKKMDTLGDFVHLADLRKAVPAWEKWQFDKVLAAARQRGHVTLSAAERDTRDEGAFIHDVDPVTGRGTALSHVSRRVTNAFCPTGEGGGVDPTCSPVHGIHSIATVGYKTDADAAKAVSRVRAEMDRLTERYPRLKAAFGERKLGLTLHNVKDVHLSTGEAVGAVYTPSSGKMDMGFKDQGGEEKLAFGSKSIVTSGNEGEFRHELGHHLQAITTHSGLGKQAEALQGFYGFTGAMEADAGTTKVDGLMKFMGKKISKYASTNKAEAFAESFAAYTSPKYARGGLPKNIEAYFDRALGGK